MTLLQLARFLYIGPDQGPNLITDSPYRRCRESRTVYTLRSLYLS